MISHSPCSLYRPSYFYHFLHDFPYNISFMHTAPYSFLLCQFYCPKHPTATLSSSYRSIFHFLSLSTTTQTIRTCLIWLIGISLLHIFRLTILKKLIYAVFVCVTFLLFSYSVCSKPMSPVEYVEYTFKLYDSLSVSLSLSNVV